jgi:hypothetical protein
MVLLLLLIGFFNNLFKDEIKRIVREVMQDKESLDEQTAKVRGI